MQIIIHDSLLGMTLAEAMQYVRREVPLKWHGTEIVVSLKPGCAIIEPYDNDSINLFGTYGEGTGYTLLCES